MKKAAFGGRLIFALLLLVLNSIHFPCRLSAEEKRIEAAEFAPEEYISQSGNSGFKMPLGTSAEELFLTVEAERPEVRPYKERWLLLWRTTELKTILENGEQYRYYVRRRLIEENMPSIIEYIPVIESSYKALATPANGSSVGLWQFMENSIANYLRKTPYLDERRDPWKSTDAALKKLRANYNQFGDWLLAIAAYNCGAGAVQRALKKTKQKTFWSLAQKKLIPEHAANYVPNLLAVAEIATNAAWYGIDIPPLEFSQKKYSPFDDFEYWTAKESVSLESIASALRMDLEILKHLNPALIQGITPPDEEYEIRLPVGTAKVLEDFCRNSKR